MSYAAIPMADNERYVTGFLKRMAAAYALPAPALPEVSQHFHNANVTAGWWTDIHTGEDLHGKRNLGELHALMDSEVSEALEAWRKDLMDDKIPTRKGLEVELGDTLIRLFDTLGSVLRDHLPPAHLDEPWIVIPRNITNVGDILMRIHVEIARCYLAWNQGDSQTYIVKSFNLFYAIMNAGCWLGLDLAGAVIEKAEYNRNRADHKPENRRLAGGKKI